MKKIGYILFCLVLLFQMSACGGDRKTQGLDKIVFVVEKGVSKTITKQMKAITEEIEEETGVSVAVETSGKYEKVRGTIEILVGETDRELSEQAYEALPERGYLMKYADDSIVIAGTNDAMLSYAIGRFYSMYIEGGVDLTSIRELDESSNKEDIVVVAENGESYYSVAVSPESDCAMASTYENNGVDVEVGVMFEVMDIIEDNIDGEVVHSTFYEADEERKEILIGDLGRDEFAEAKAQWNWNEYGVLCMDNKIVVSGWNLETVSQAGEAFVDLLKMAVVKEPTGKAAIYFMKDQLTCLSTDKWMLDIPVYEGGTLAGTNDAAYGQFMWFYTETNETEFRNYCKKLEKEGYKLALSNENAGNLYCTYVKDDSKIHTYYTAYEQSVRIINGSIEKTGLVADNVTKEEKVTDFSILQLPLSYDEVMGGMSYLLTLEDGRFVVIDGGGSVAKDATLLYETMEELNQRDDGIVIAGWFLSHEHDDHYGVFDKFMSKYGKKVTLEMFYCSIPSYSFSYNSQNPEYFMTTDFPQISEKYGTIPIAIVHTGQRFLIGNATFEILYTTEDIYPGKFTFFNDASVIIRVSTEAGSALFLADAADTTSDILCRRYGAYLKSDLVQMGHHGWNGATYEVYELAQPEMILWPNSQKEYEKGLVGDNPTYRIINRQVVALVGEDNIYVADGKIWQFKFPAAQGTVYKTIEQQ